MSALLAVILTLLAGIYVALPGLREEVGDLPHELDRSGLEGELEAEAEAWRAWARAAGELEATETMMNDGGGA